MIRIIPLAIIILLLSACSSPSNVPIEPPPPTAPVTLPEIVIRPPTPQSLPRPRAAPVTAPAKVAKQARPKALKHPILVKHETAVPVSVHVPARALQTSARKPVNGRR